MDARNLTQALCKIKRVLLTPELKASLQAPPRPVSFKALACMHISFQTLSLNPLRCIPATLAQRYP